MFFRWLYDEKLAQSSYFLGCEHTGEAIVVDPLRDVEKYIRIAEEKSMEIVGIAETHIHADFLSGSRELAEKTGATLYLSEAGGFDEDYLWLNQNQHGGSYRYQLLDDGDIFSIGTIEFTVLHTPGHSPEHLSFLVKDTGNGALDPIGILTGDFVLAGDVGRPILADRELQDQSIAEMYAQQMFDSLQRFLELPDFLQVWPAHGAGSIDAKVPRAIPFSTVGYEKRYNSAVLSLEKPSLFSKNMLMGIPDAPPYFKRMKRLNREGPPLLVKFPSPEQVDIPTLINHLSSPGIILDTRDWADFQKAYLPGALHTPLKPSFPTVVGSFVLDPGSPIFLIIEPAHLQETITDLIRIGYDNIVGFATPQQLQQYFQDGGHYEQVTTLPITQFSKHSSGTSGMLLDVRRSDEFMEGHLPDAIHIPHTQLAERIEELPDQEPIFVHCRTEGRSAYAVSLLKAVGKNAIQLTGGYLAWEEAGREIIR
ncbi:MAG: MBL fold metallo-hydrolase [Calditrichaeota bacterium]|nr:MAG: MBL fold metallo-hydrolase [Calditrichota bacterium]